MLLSIIIPVYNAEKYLSRCLDSVLKSIEKSGQKVEIILINNNSTDKSAEIIQDFIKLTPPRTIRSEVNLIPGAAATRNLGATFAKGDYLWFIDADDYISEDAISLLAKTINSAKTAKPSKVPENAKSIRTSKITPTFNHKPDLVMFGADNIGRDGAKIRYFSPVDPATPDYKSRFVRYGMGPWQVVINRRWWEKYRFAFREGIIHEDMELMSALILFTNHLAAINQPLYFYCDNPGSVLHKKGFNPRSFDIFPALTGLYERFTAQNATKTYHDELEWFFIWNLLIDSAKDFRVSREGRIGIKDTRRFLQEYFPNWSKNRFLREKPLKLRLRVRLNYLGF